MAGHFRRITGRRVPASVPHSHHQLKVKIGIDDDEARLRDSGRSRSIVRTSGGREWSMDGRAGDQAVDHA